MSNQSQPTWTILIPTIGQRADLFRRLLDRLLPQLDAHAGRVRVLAFWNNGEPTLGQIRDSLVFGTDTDYVSFIDDDDLVPEFFVEECVRAIEQWPDKVGFKVGYSVDGDLKEIADQSIRHGDWHRDAAGVLCRDITHVGPIRASIARKGRFAIAKRGRAEDRVWVKQVRPHVRTEVYVDRVMYDYLFSPSNSSWQHGSKVVHTGERPVIDHPYFTWHEGIAVNIAAPAVPRHPLRAGNWQRLLPFPLDVEASYETFNREGEGGYKQDYKGLGIWKNVDDMARYRRVIEETKPEVVVETGTRWGGFAAWIVGEFPGTEVITVDLDTETRPAEWPGVTFVAGDSTDVAVAEKVRKMVGDRRCMVSLDADHHAPAVWQELDLHASLVSPGCYLVVEDGLADIVTARRARRMGHQIPQLGGPLVAIAASPLPRSPLWRRAREIEEMSPITYYPAGWWERLAP
jgi:cephalosporin hydroxylase